MSAIAAATATDAAVESVADLPGTAAAGYSAGPVVVVAAPGPASEASLGSD